MRNVRALVTGGAGFIGSHIVDALLARGDHVCVIDSLDARVHSGVPPSFSDGVEFVRADICSSSVLSNTLSRGVDVVFHEAAMVGLGKGGADAEEYVTTNIIGTSRLMRAIADLPRQSRPRVVLASTMAIYGEGAYICRSCQKPRGGTRNATDLGRSQWEPRCDVCNEPLEPQAVSEDHPPHPGTVYAISKLGQEYLCMTLGREADVSVIALRYHNVYGPRMPRNTPYAGVASIFKSRLLAGLPPLVYEDGNQLRDFIHVTDIAQANLLVADAPPGEVAFQAYNVGTGRPHRILDFAQELAKTLAPSLAPQFAGSFRLGDARHIFADTSKIARLGFRPSVSFEDGVSQFAKEPTRASPQVVFS